MLVRETWETIYMVFLFSALSYVIGIPLGVTLVVTDREDINPASLLNKVLGPIINLLRSVPFIILLVMVLPTTKFIVGKAIGSNTMVMPLIIAAPPRIERMVEPSLKEVDAGVIEAVKSTGAPTWQIIVRVLLPETEPPLLVGVAISVTAIFGYSAMTGFTGGGGLGNTTTRYGYHRYQTGMMMATVMPLAIVTRLAQEVVMRMSRRSDERVRQEDPGSGAGKRIRWGYPFPDSGGGMYMIVI